MFPPSPDPWKGGVGYRLSSGWPPQRLPTLVGRVWPSWGIFDPASYSPDGFEADRLAETIDRIRGMGSTPVVAILPESTAFRSYLPSNAAPALEAAIARAFAPERPAVLDLRGAIPDEFFSDPMHVDYRGRERTTRLIAERLGEFRKAGPGAPRPDQRGGGGKM